MKKKKMKALAKFAKRLTTIDNVPRAMADLEWASEGFLEKLDSDAPMPHPLVLVTISDALTFAAIAEGTLLSDDDGDARCGCGCRCGSGGPDEAIHDAAQDLLAQIDHVERHDRTTVVFWRDGKVTSVRCAKVCIAIAKRAAGSGHALSAAIGSLEWSDGTGAAEDEPAKRPATRTRKSAKARVSHTDLSLDERKGGRR